MKTRCLPTHHVPNCMNCHKAIVVITWRANCLIIAYILCSTMCPSGYNHNGCLETHALGDMKYG